MPLTAWWRDLRRRGAGRESSFVYHHAGAAIAPLLLPFITYLALPVSPAPGLDRAAGRRPDERGRGTGRAQFQEVSVSGGGRTGMEAYPSAC